MHSNDSFRKILRNSYFRFRRQIENFESTSNVIAKRKCMNNSVYSNDMMKNGLPSHTFRSNSSHSQLFPSPFTKPTPRLATISLTEYFISYPNPTNSKPLNFHRNYSEPARANENYSPHHAESNEPNNSTSRTSSSASEKNFTTDEAIRALQNPNAVLPLDDLKFLFSRLSTVDLANALLNLEIAANNLAVDFGKKVLQSRAINVSIFNIPLRWCVKNTAFKHFCAGETLEEASECLLKMFELGLKGILDFSVEDAHTNEICDKNLENFIKTINLTHSLPRGAVSFACVKISALCPLSSLEKASNLLRLHHIHPSLSPPWMLPSLPVLSSDSPPHLPSSSPSDPLPSLPPLTEQEEQDILSCHSRLLTISNLCKDLSLSLLIDAEYQSIQPIIDHLAYALVLTHNTSDYPLIFTTIQAYLKDSGSRLRLAIASCRKSNVGLGVKIVRGAYLSRETNLSKCMNVPNPIFSTIEETHASYDACVKTMLESIKENENLNLNSNAVVLATHNYNSGCQAVLHASAIGIAKEDKRFHFAQLKGMADTLSLSLLFSGHNVSKYLAYGSVMEVMPYLLRRAEENSAILSNTLPERMRLRKELWRRFRAWLGIHE